MRSILFILLFALISCESGQGRKTELVSRFTPEELKIQTCFDAIDRQCSGDCEAKKIRQCLPGTSYSMSRAPASKAESAQLNALVSQNQWLFGSQKFVLHFLDIIGKLKEAHSKMRELSRSTDSYLSEKFHGRGVGVVGNAYFGIGRSWLGEVVLHQDSLALFCAPGVSIVTDAGVDIGVVGVTTLACEKNRDYHGAFLSASISVSAEAFLAPVSGGLSYSFGFDSQKFQKGLKELRQDRDFSFSRLISEWAMLTARAPQYPLAFAALAPIVSELGRSPYASKKMRSKYLHDLLKRKTSLGHIIKNVANDRKVASVIAANDLSAVKSFLKLMADSLTGCDSIAGSAALSVSASPVGLGVSHTYYTELLQANVSLLKKATPFVMANPFLLGLAGAKVVVSAARDIRSLPKKIMSCESNQARDLLNFF